MIRWFFPDMVRLLNQPARPSSGSRKARPSMDAPVVPQVGHNQAPTPRARPDLGFVLSRVARQWKWSLRCAEKLVKIERAPDAAGRSSVMAEVDPARQQAAAHRLVLGRRDLMVIYHFTPLYIILSTHSNGISALQLQNSSVSALIAALADRPQAALPCHPVDRAQLVVGPGGTATRPAYFHSRTKDDPPTGGQGSLCFTVGTR